MDITKLLYYTSCGDFMNNIYNAKIIGNNGKEIKTLCFLLKIDNKLVLVLPNNFKIMFIKNITISKFSINFIFDIKEENIRYDNDLVFITIDCVYFDENNILKDNRPHFSICDMHKLVYATKEDFDYTPYKKEDCYVNILNHGIDKTIPFANVDFSLLTKGNKIYGVVIGNKVVNVEF